MGEVSGAADAGSGTHRIEFRFTDGIQRTVDVPGGEVILDAGLEAGISILHQCRSGCCASCVAKLVTGSVSRRAGGRSVLLKSETEAGYRLLCQSQAVGPAVFELAYDSEAGAARTARVHAFVDAVEQLASNVVRLKLELAAHEWLNFRPGQFIQMTVPGTDIVRSFSPATTPASLPSLEFLIRLLPGGVMSEWLRQKAARDDIVEIEGPYGSFFLREKIRAPHILVAGGTGLAPMLSIIDALRAQPGRKAHVLLSFGCASLDTLFGLEAINLRRQWLPTLESRISVDRGATGELLSGTPVDALQPEDVTDPATVAYLCGPPPMVAAAHARLEALGVKSENIFVEQFVASSRAGA